MDPKAKLLACEENCRIMEAECKGLSLFKLEYYFCDKLKKDRINTMNQCYSICREQYNFIKNL